MTNPVYRDHGNMDKPRNHNLECNRLLIALTIVAHQVLEAHLWLPGTACV